MRVHRFLTLMSLFTGLLVVCGVGASAQDFTITRTVFVPSVYYVGDEVEMRINLRTDYYAKLVVPQEIPQPSWGRISNIRIIPHEDEPEIRLSFVSYMTGTRSLPPINLGAIVLDGQNIYVTSLLANQDMAPKRDQMVIPGTGILVFLQVLVILAVPAVLILLFLLWRRRGVSILGAYREKIPFRKISRSLRNMTGELENMDARTFYIRVLDETRMYLSDRLRISAISATTGELEKELETRVSNVEISDTILNLFKRGDRVKFASEAASVNVRMSDVHQLEMALRYLETEERARKKERDRALTKRAGQNADIRPS